MRLHVQIASHLSWKSFISAHFPPCKLSSLHSSTRISPFLPVFCSNVASSTAIPCNYHKSNTSPSHKSGLSNHCFPTLDHTNVSLHCLSFPCASAEPQKVKAGGNSPPSLHRPQYPTNITNYSSSQSAPDSNSPAHYSPHRSYP